MPIGSYVNEKGIRRKFGSRISLKAGNAGSNFLTPEIFRIARKEELVVEPGPVSAVLPDRTAQPRRIRDDVGKRGEPIYRPYKTLGTTFFQGSAEGQLQSVYKARISNPQNLVDYKAAVLAGDCILPTTRKSKALLRKLEELGFDRQQGE
ncbi:MAG: hypothetical protein M3178_08910 [Pseudomonadota bacterium]|nr:hypothetical protein [Pseudomonadota bacterium]